ncbi:MAG: VWA domain-containing protein [Desulfobacterales bacterium]
MTTGISEFWRKNTSPIEAVELANVLRALRKVSGYLGENIGTIEYAGMSRRQGSGIVLDPELAMGQYPLPFSQMDYLVGLVTHEALHRVEWSDHVWKILEPVFQEMGPMAMVRFQKIVHFGEDIYVDIVADKKIFGRYVRKLRDRIITEIASAVPSGKASLDELVYIWWAEYHTRASEDPPIRDEYKRSITILNHLTEELISVSRLEKGATARCEKRAELYADAFRQIEHTGTPLYVHDKKLYWYPSAASPFACESAGRKKGEKPAPSIPKDVLNEIELQLAGSSIDMTPIIQSIVGYDNEDVIPTSRWDFTVSAHPMIDRRIVSRLKAAFRQYAGRNKIISRGLPSGKIDRRRLYRAATTGRCFQQHDDFPNLDWNVTLLMDASGSMRGNKWRMVENTVANIHKALTGFHNHLQALAYFEKDGILMISQLIRNNRIQSVPPSGLTASGQAIIAAAWLMPKRRKRNILIHVTDGESNLGCDVQYGIDYCRKAHIDLITLGCGYKDRDAMIRQYGKSIQFLDHFGQLARAMERLLKWTFIYGKRPNLNEKGEMAFLTQRSTG